jgi:PTH1 family peptidyl-tRNA hydrolase
MAWLQRRPQTSNPQSYYTLGLNKTVLLVGLGNPGKEYDQSRHNIGFDCLDEFVRSTETMADWLIKKDLKCHMSLGQLGDTRVIAIKPTTFMNLSGEAVSAVINFYKIDHASTVIVHDDIDVNFGQIRCRLGGSSAGHNGIKSVSQAIGEDYGRIRVGIGPKPANISAEKFVLNKFNKTEELQLANLDKEVTAILNEYVFGTGLTAETRSFII